MKVFTLFGRSIKLQSPVVIEVPTFAFQIGGLIEGKNVTMYWENSTDAQALERLQSLGSQYQSRYDQDMELHLWKLEKNEADGLDYWVEFAGGYLGVETKIEFVIERR